MGGGGGGGARASSPGGWLTPAPAETRPAQVSAARPRRPALENGLPRPLLAALLGVGAARLWDLLLLFCCLALLFVRNETYWAVRAPQFVCFRNSEDPRSSAEGVGGMLENRSTGLGLSGRRALRT